MRVKTSRKLVSIARKPRKDSTEVEKYLWRYLRGEQLEGYKFRRQQPIGKYVVDFVNFERKIVIEADGGQHAIDKEKDRKRDEWLNREGFKVLRFWDNEIFTNIEGVIEIIREKLLTPHPASPTRGEVKKDENS